MSAASAVAFGLVFLGATAVWSLLLGGLALASAKHLRRLGPWVERRAAVGALVLPPLFGVALVMALAARSAVALSAGTDHCLRHPHHLHLCLKHGAAWASQPWALVLVIFAATFVGVRSALALWAHFVTQRAVYRLRRVGDPLEQGGCYIVPARDRFAFTAGLFAPTVIVSTAAWDTLELEQREAIMAHELTHVAHGDLWRRAALGFAASLGFPLVTGPMLRLWELSAERICDRNAAEAVERPSIVASAMLALVGASRPPVAARGAVFAAASHVRERIESLLGDEPSGESPSRRLLLLVAFAAASFAIGCLIFAEPVHHALETILG